MSAIPPKQSPDSAPDEAPASGGELVAMYNAASHAGAESFPVLKAFQDYIEAERTQARKRVMQLSVFYAVLMGVVVTGFLTAGIFMLRNMTSMQSKLLDVALANKTAPAPAVAQTVPSPMIEESMRQMSRATAELQSDLGKKLDGVSEVASQVHAKMASQDGEMEKLRDELRQMQEQSAKLKDELVAIKTEAKKPAHQPFYYTPPPQRPAPEPAAPTVAAQPAPKPAVPAAPVPTAVIAVQKPAAPVVSSAPAAVAAAVPAPAAAIAVAPPPVATVTAPPKPEAFHDSRFPPAVKDPPQTPTGVQAPATPQGMMATAVPLKTKNMGSIPWRVLIPE